MRVLKWIGIFAVAAFIAIFAVSRAADGPIGPITGGPLIDGELHPGAEPDWSFVHDVREVELQTLDPARSRTTWILDAGGRAFIPCGYMDTTWGRLWKQWPIEAERDGRAVLRIGGVRYERTLVRVRDPELVAAVVAEFARKYVPGVTSAAVESESLWIFELAPRSQAASLAITGARIWTGVERAPWAEAIAFDGTRIAAVGRMADVAPLITPATRVIDAQGGMVVPGFIDTHVHFVQGGAGLTSVQLRDAASIADFSQRIAAFATSRPTGEWIQYGNWDHELWGGELPDRTWIDPVTPEHPVFIERLDGHMALTNSLALQLAGITAQTPDVEGGTIVRDADGNPTGVLKDNAMDLVRRVIPAPSAAQLDEIVLAAMSYVAARGVTSVHDMGDWASLDAYRRAHAAGRLITRIHAFMPLQDWQRLRDDVANHGRGGDWLATGGLKGFVDGSLGSHTAAFLEPFTDAPDDRGLLLNDPAALETWIAGADAANLQVTVHAIGDRAIRSLLDSFEVVTATNGERNRRFRIEHAQHIHPEDIPRFASASVIASMQPYHAIDDGRWADRVIGAERSATTYAFRSLLDTGAHVSFGSDWPVAPPSPIEGIYAAVTRATLDGAHPDGWVPAQKITVEEALAAYTRDAAFTTFDELRTGRLAIGMLADAVLIDRDLTTTPPAQLRDARVLATIVAGVVVYEAPGGRN